MTRARGVSWAGLFAGPGAWAVSTQADYSLVGAQCIFGIYPVPWVSLVLALIALGGAALSFLAFRTVRAEPGATSRKPRTEVFLSLTGIGIGVLFALGILLQAYAGAVFTGCER